MGGRCPATDVGAPALDASAGIGHASSARRWRPIFAIAKIATTGAFLNGAGRGPERTVMANEIKSLTGRAGPVSVRLAVVVEGGRGQGNRPSPRGTTCAAPVLGTNVLTIWDRRIVATHNCSIERLCAGASADLQEPAGQRSPHAPDRGARPSARGGRPRRGNRRASAWTRGGSRLAAAGGLAPARAAPRRAHGPEAPSLGDPRRLLPRAEPRAGARRGRRRPPAVGPRSYALGGQRVGDALAADPCPRTGRPAASPAGPARAGHRRRVRRDRSPRHVRGHAPAPRAVSGSGRWRPATR